MSISFDRAAGYYDETRAFPDHIMARLIPMLATQLPANELCLEIGIGTGRIALPLIAADVRIVGIDISVEMLRRLREKAGDGAPSLAIADATRLPFADSTFGSAVAAHVLHLVSGWTRAVDELVRVVRPGGVVVASRGGTARTGWQHAVRRAFFAEAGNPAWPPGMDNIGQLDVEMAARGATLIEMPELINEHEVSINSVISNLEAGTWSACWTLDEATRRRAGAAAREWAERELGDLDAPRPATSGSVWRGYKLPEKS